MWVLQIIISFFMLMISYFVYSVARKDHLDNIRNVSVIKTKQGYSEELLKWLFIKNKGNGIELFFNDKKIKSISIYGAGEVGKILFLELKDKLKVNYFIDKQPEKSGNNLYDIDVIKPCKPVSPDFYGDAVIVALLHDADKIVKRDLEKLNINIPIYNMRDILASEYLK